MLYHWILIKNDSEILLSIFYDIDIFILLGIKTIYCIINIIYDMNSFLPKTLHLKISLCVLNIIIHVKSIPTNHIFIEHIN